MAKMWLNKGIKKTKPTLPSLYLSVRNQASGIRNQASGVMFHLRNFFYTFVKNILIKLTPADYGQYKHSLGLTSITDSWWTTVV